ncbi:MAG: type II toxin-antitoxin system RelE/ParE family toxin [Rhizobiaceae bacterium]
MKSRTVFFSPEALEDLEHIYDWIADAGSPNAAMAYVQRIESACRSLDLASNRGQARDDIRPGLRTVGFERRLTIAFTVGSESVTILRIFAGGRDWEGDG